MGIVEFSLLSFFLCCVVHYMFSMGGSLCLVKFHSSLTVLEDEKRVVIVVLLIYYVCK